MNKMTLTKEELNQILDDVIRLEDCILEGIPPHSGYRGAAKRLVQKIRIKIQRTCEQMEQNHD